MASLPRPSALALAGVCGVLAAWLLLGQRPVASAPAALYTAVPTTAATAHTLGVRRTARAVGIGGAAPQEAASSLFTAAAEEAVPPSQGFGSMTAFTAGGVAMLVAVGTFLAKHRRSGSQAVAGAALAGGLSLCAADGAAAVAIEPSALFAKACVACHVGGGNLLIEGHTLSQTAMEKYLEGGCNRPAIEYQIRHGKGPMPAWEGVLTDAEIAALRDYVYEQSSTEWADL